MPAPTTDDPSPQPDPAAGAVDAPHRDGGHPDLGMDRSLAALMEEWLDRAGTAAERRLREDTLRRVIERVDERQVLGMQHDIVERVRDHVAALNDEVRTDPLTGLANRRGVGERLELELRRAERTDRPFALVLFDVDGLKALNDTWGHSHGDRALVGIGAVLRSAARGVDLAGRVGGDEFVIICPDTDATGAASLVSRVLSGVAAAAVDGAALPTLSAGIAVASPGRPTTLADLVATADTMLYAERRRSRPVLTVLGPDRLNLDGEAS